MMVYEIHANGGHGLGPTLVGEFGICRPCVALARKRRCTCTRVSTPWHRR
jgi:hypothetical protein